MMLLKQADLESIHRYCSNHRPLLERSASAGCFNCGASFAPAEIREWIREPDRATGRSDGETARCPKCGVDSVLPSAAPVTLDERMLHAMRSYWFRGAP